MLPFINFVRTMEICTTNGIRVSVETQYLPAHSNARADKFIFGYHIVIENGSSDTVQLLRRRWVITESNGITRVVEGEGVVGQQPLLEPGAIHQYTSFCNLMTEVGKMSGVYVMTRLDDGDVFEVLIPEFKMHAPFKLN
jgi:ApaG protein